MSKQPLYPHIPKSRLSVSVPTTTLPDTILYHGTTRDRAEGILKSGLQPSPYEPNLTTDFKAAWDFGLIRAGRAIPLLPGEPYPSTDYFIQERDRLAKPNTAVVEFILSQNEMREFDCGIEYNKSGFGLGGCLKWLKVPRMRIITSDRLE